MRVGWSRMALAIYLRISWLLTWVMVVTGPSASLTSRLSQAHLYGCGSVPRDKNMLSSGTGTLPLLPLSIGQSKSPGQPRLKEGNRFSSLIRGSTKLNCKGHGYRES